MNQYSHRGFSALPANTFLNLAHLDTQNHDSNCIQEEHLDFFLCVCISHETFSLTPPLLAFIIAAVTLHFFSDSVSCV